MIKIAYVDDCKKDRETIQEFIDRVIKEQTEEISLSLHEDSLKFFEKFAGDYDIILLDIEMPLLNGMELAKKLRTTGTDCSIIFITNMAQYAIKGYEVDAVGYILKPVKYYTFKEVLKKAIDRVISLRKEEMKVVINGRNGVEIVQASIIKYVEVQGHDLILHTIKGEYSCHKTMKEVESLLSDKGFVRCNHCYIVNLKYVDSVEGNDVLIGDARIVMSRNKKKNFIEELIKYTR